MTIIYSLVAKDSVVLGEYTSNSGNFQTFVWLLLERMPKSDERVTYVYDRYSFHNYNTENFTYLAMCENQDNDNMLTLPYVYLKEIADIVEGNWLSKTETYSVAHCLNETLSPIFEFKMNKWNEIMNSGQALLDKNHINKQISNIQNILMDNIDKLIQRHEKINLLVYKTASLKNESVEYKRNVFENTNRQIHPSRLIFVLLLAIVGTILILFIYVLFKKKQFEQ